MLIHVVVRFFSFFFNTFCDIVDIAPRAISDIDAM